LVLAGASLAEGPRWQEVPDRLKWQEGFAIRGAVLYATGRAESPQSARPDKSADTTRRRSFLRALYFVQQASLTGVQSIAFRGRLHLQGLNVIRQWERDGAHFTTVAVPAIAITHAGKRNG
jgi:hypothetical protein